MLKLTLEDGLAEGDAEGLPDGLADGLLLKLSDALGEAEGLAEGEAESDADILADGEADGEAEGEAEGLALIDADGLADGDKLGEADTLLDKLILELKLGDREGLNIFTLSCQSASSSSSQVKFRLPSLLSTKDTNVNKYAVLLRNNIPKTGLPPDLPAVLA